MSSNSLNNNTSSKSTSSKSKRYEGSIQVDSTLMGPLIGRGGCNIRRICSTCRFGTFIKGLDDGSTFKISSYSLEAVRKAAKMIKMDEEALIDPTKRSSKPFQTLMIDDEYVSHVVGKDGGGIRTIMDKVGDGCYIVHRDGQFHITGNSNDDVLHAIKLIHREREAYIKWSNDSTNTPTTRQDIYTNYSPKTQTHHRNTYGAFESDSSDDEDDCEFPPLRGKSVITLKVSEKTPWNNTNQLLNVIGTSPSSSLRPNTTKVPVQPKSWADMADSDSDSDSED